MLSAAWALCISSSISPPPKHRRYSNERTLAKLGSGQTVQLKDWWHLVTPQVSAKSARDWLPRYHKVWLNFLVCSSQRLATMGCCSLLSLLFISVARSTCFVRGSQRSAASKAWPWPPTVVAMHRRAPKKSYRNTSKCNQTNYMYLVGLWKNAETTETPPVQILRLKLITEAREFFHEKGANRARQSSSSCRQCSLASVNGTFWPCTGTGSPIDLTIQWLLSHEKGSLNGDSIAVITSDSIVFLAVITSDSMVFNDSSPNTEGSDPEFCV